jgi:4-alpha-glucanotransferase
LALARHYGLRTSYKTQDNGLVQVADESLVGVLAAIGVPISHPDQAAELLDAFGRTYRALEPVIVRRPGARSLHYLNLPATVTPAQVKMTLRYEDGSLASRSLQSLVGGPPQTRQIDGVAVTRHGFKLTGPFAPAPGYHHLEVEGPGLCASALLISAPRHVPAPDRGWGVFAPLYAVRTATDWGVASFRELAEIGDWAGELGGNFVGTLPLFACFLDGPILDTSPYRPASRLALNELYIDVERIPELEIAPEARRMLVSAGFCRRLDRLRSAPTSDPCATMAVKRQVLELLADALASNPSSRRTALEDFLAERPEVEAYARFRSATETLGRPWRQWGGSQPGTIPAGADDERRVRYHRYAQWVAETQLAEVTARGRLYPDLPLGSHPDGFDTWSHPASFATGASVGAPPDSFQAAGQDWGINPLHPERSRQDGYRYLIAVFRQAFRHAAVLRVDHVMGLHRLWWIPEGMAPTDGAYVGYRSEELRAIAVLEATRAGAAVVGEDLGTVAAAVHVAMSRDGMLRSHVHQFTATADDPFPNPPPDSLASISTHDLPPFACWWAGLDIDDRARRGTLDPGAAAEQRTQRTALRSAVTAIIGPLVSPGRALQAILVHLAGGPARLVLVDLEDLWLEREPQNRPGTAAAEGNFRRRWVRRWPEGLRARRSVPAAMLRLVNTARRGGQSGGDGAGDFDPEQE